MSAAYDYEDRYARADQGPDRLLGHQQDRRPQRRSLRQDPRRSRERQRRYQAVVECYDDIAEAANCAVHLWHHTRKTGGGEVTIELVTAPSPSSMLWSANVLETMTKAERQRLRIERPSPPFSRVQRQAKLCSNKRGIKLVSSHRCRDRQRWNVFRRRSRCG